MSVFVKAEVIWGSELEKNTWMCFRKKFNIETVQGENILKVEADSKYWIYINGKIIVREGGLNRESKPGCGYYDQLDISKYLNEGLNLLCVLVWYWGVSGRNNIDSNQPGLRLECEKLNLFSSEDFIVKKHFSYIEADEPHPSYLYGGHDICFKASKEFENWFMEGFDDTDWTNAKVIKNNIWGEPVKRPIPFHKFSKIRDYTTIRLENNAYECILPYACQLNPYLEVVGKGNEKIIIYTDKYSVNGGPGDSGKYRGHKIEYVTRNGKQRFESFNWIFGEKVYYVIPESVKLLRLGFRESGYDCKISGVFRCDNKEINKLVDKCSRTLYVCMRDNYMDCPDRERGQWIGDVSCQIPQTFYSLSRSADYLSEKAIQDFLNFRKDKIIFGNVPGIDYAELPSQSLNAISDVGLIPEYYRFSGNKEIIKKSYEAIKDYVLLWNINQDGLVEGRMGDWRWFDHNENQDEKLLENIWYYLALKSAIKFAEMCGKETDKKEFEKRSSGIKEAISNFWTDDVYKSIDIPDDRANGMILLADLYKEGQEYKIVKFLRNNFFATPYMEYYILEGMCKAGFCQYAIDRMLNRYEKLIENENSTLWEDFYILGTKNHAWSGGPLAVLYKYVAGIYPLTAGMQHISVLPQKTQLNNIEASMEVTGGQLNVSIKYYENNCYIRVDSPAGCKIRVGAPFINVTNVYINGKKRNDYEKNDTHTYIDCDDEIVEFMCEL